MKKIIWVLACGQFLLSLVIGYICFEFYRGTASSAAMETQLADNCASLKTALEQVHTSYSQTEAIVADLSVQLPRLGKGLKGAGRTIYLVSREAGDALVATGKNFRTAGYVLHGYRKNVMPAVKDSLLSTTRSLEMAENTVKENKPYTQASHYLVLLGICFIVICVLNGSCFVYLALKKP